MWYSIKTIKIFFSLQQNLLVFNWDFLTFLKCLLVFKSLWILMYFFMWWILKDFLVQNTHKIFIQQSHSNPWDFFNLPRLFFQPTGLPSSGSFLHLQSIFFVNTCPKYFHTTTTWSITWYSLYCSRKILFTQQYFLVHATTWSSLLKKQHDWYM
jgi:hypothetical protein